MYALKKESKAMTKVEVFTLPHRFLPESSHSGGMIFGKIEIPVAYHSSFETGMLHRNAPEWILEECKFSYC